MASAEVLNLASLLEPIPGPSPAGIDLRTDPSSVSPYQLIKEDRKANRQIETQIDRAGSDGVKDISPPDWRSLVEKATKALAEQTKDLEITAYLIEAEVRIHGFAGMRDGFRLARELVDTYWDGLYPSPGDPDIETRFAHILQLNGIDSAGALIVPIAKIPFTERTGSGEFSMVHHQAAKATGAITDAKARQAKIDGGAMTIEKIQRAVAETSSEFYRDLMEDLEGAGREFQLFCAALSAKSGYDASSANIRQALEDYKDVVRSLAQSKLAKVAKQAPAQPVAANDEAQGGGAAAGSQPAPEAGEIRTRSDALAHLLKVADFFRESEPQSVIPYALEQVVYWGKLSLPELLAELIPDEAPRKGLFKQVGIKPAEASKEGAKK